VSAVAPIIAQLREHGTEVCIQASLTPARDGVLKALERQNRMFAKLIQLLEDSHKLRRGHTVAMICAAEEIKESAPAA
jgi:hypothetical protein